MLTPKNTSRSERPWASSPLFRNTLVPVASLEDAQMTSDTVLPAIGHSGGVVTALHIIGIANGWTRQGPSFYRHELASDILDLIERCGRRHGMAVKKRILYEPDVPTAILRVADDIDASSIVFTPRGSGRWRSFFSRNTALELVKKARRPVVVIPADSVEGEMN